MASGDASGRGAAMMEHHHSDRSVAAFALPVLRGEPLPDVSEPQAPEVAEGLRKAGLTSLALARMKDGASPAALRRALERERDRQRADLAFLYDRLGRLAEVLGAAGVPFIVLKGAALGPLLYDSPESRPMVDVDVLLRRRDWPAAARALGAAGYRLPKESDQTYWLANYFNMGIGTPGPREVSFDVHWGLTQEVRYKVDEDGLWARATPYRIADREYLRLGNEDLLLSLILHLAYHYFDARLLWLHDVHLLVRRLPIDWDAAETRAAAWRMAAVLAFGLAFVEKVIPGSIPRPVLERTTPGPLRRLLTAPLISREPGRLFRGDDVRALQLVQGILVMDGPLHAARFAADKISRRLRFLGARPRLR